VLLAVLDASEVFVLAAVLATAAVPVLRAGVAERPPRRTERVGVRETLRANRLLLADRDTRALLLALSVPNGLVVGCEALFVPYAGESAGWLLAGAAAGMMAGDLLVGRALTPAGRRRASTPLRYLLAAPYLVFALQPGVPLAVVVAAVASLGYAATLAQQEWLVALTPAGLRGQVLGVESSVRMTLQGVCAVAAGLLADLLTPAAAVVVLALASIAVSLALTRALARTGARAADVSERRPGT
jgi:predicted MFS family arabinose efflux permease